MKPVLFVYLSSPHKKKIHGSKSRLFGSAGNTVNIYKVSERDLLLLRERDIFRDGDLKKQKTHHLSFLLHI